MNNSPVDDAVSASWWPDFLSVKDSLSWAALSSKFGPSANTLRSALAAVGQSKAPMAPGRKPKARFGAPEASETPNASPVASKLAATPRAAAKSGGTGSGAGAAGILNGFRAQLGNAPDGEIAERAGVSLDDVKAYRREHQIPAYYRPPPSAAAAPAPAVAARAVAAGGKVVESDSVVRRRRSTNGVTVDEVVVRTPASAPASAPAAADASNPLEPFRGQLGKVADHVIAAQAKVDRTVVGAWRRKLGVPPYDGFRQRKGGAAAGAAPEAAARATVERAGPTNVEARPSVARVPQAERGAPAAKGKPGRRSAIDAFFHLVGKQTDAEVASKAHVSVAAVTQYRIRRGIPAAGRASSAARAAAASAGATSQTAPIASRPAPAEGAASGAAPSAIHAGSASKDVRHRRSKLDSYAHLVGVLSDTEVALLANVSSEGVRQYRRRHGISAASGRSQADESASIGSAASVAARAPAPAAAPTSAAHVPSSPYVASSNVASSNVASSNVASSNVAYSVIAHHGDESRRFVAVGADIREALTRGAAALDARADGPWVIQSVRRLCDALG